MQECCVTAYPTGVGTDALSQNTLVSASLFHTRVANASHITTVRWIFITEILFPDVRYLIQERNTVVIEYICPGQEGTSHPFHNIRKH